MLRVEQLGFARAVPEEPGVELVGAGERALRLDIVLPGQLGLVDSGGGYIPVGYVSGGSCAGVSGTCSGSTPRVSSMYTNASYRPGMTVGT